jgi:hypothetical protein
MLRTLKINGQSLVVSGYPRRKVTEAALERASKILDVFPFPLSVVPPQSQGLAIVMKVTDNKVENACNSSGGAKTE